jgi:hypothetical protein
MSSLQTRIQKLEAKRGGRSDVEAAIKRMGIEAAKRMRYLWIKGMLHGLSAEERGELGAILEQAGLPPLRTGSLTGGVRRNRWLDEEINKLANSRPELREFATERTWVGNLYSPGYCSRWRVQVERSDLPLKTRERASELLRHRAMDYKLDPADADWLYDLLTSSDMDLGPEGPWLRDHLEDGCLPYEPPSAR